MRLAWLVTLLLVVAGCSQQPPAVCTARDYVSGWSTMGMYLPKDQVPFFALHFKEVADVLADGLRHPKEDVRQRAAYVIEELGEQARPLEPAVIRAIGSESNRLVRLYLYSALRATGTTNPSTVTILRTKFDALPKENSEPVKGDIYTVLDERIQPAGKRKVPVRSHPVDRAAP